MSFKGGCCDVQTIRELIADKGSVSKVRQLATTIEEVKTKARDLTKRLDDLDPESTESDGSWLEDLKYNVSEIMGEVSDYLAPKCEVEPQIFQAHSVSENEAASYLVLFGQLSYSKGSGLKSVKVPIFEGNPDKWPYFWGIFSSLIDENKAMTKFLLCEKEEGNTSQITF